MIWRSACVPGCLRPIAPRWQPPWGGYHLGHWYLRCTCGLSESQAGALLGGAIVRAVAAVGYAPFHLEAGLFTAADWFGITIVPGSALSVFGIRLGWFHRQPPAPRGLAGIQSWLHGGRRLGGSGVLGGRAQCADVRVRRANQASLVRDISDLDSPAASPLGFHGIRLSNLTLGTALALVLFAAALAYRLVSAALKFGW